MFAFVVLAVPSFRPWRLAAVGVALLGGVGASYAVASVARCEAGCPEPGTTTAQQVHNAVAYSGYGAAVVGIFLFGVALRRVRGWRPIAVVSLVLGPALVVAMSGATASDPSHGLWQRMIELGVFGWISAVAWRIVTPVDSPAL